MSTDTRPLLVVLRALGLGDFLTGIPALRALGDAFPEHRKVLGAPGQLAPLAAQLGVVDEISPTPGLVPLASGLARPEVAVDLHGKGPGSQPLLVKLAPARLVAWRHPAVPETRAGPTWRPGEHEVQRWCRLLAESGIPVDPARLELSVPQVVLPEWLRGAVLLHPGAASPARRWPAERFAAVARREVAMGHRVAITGVSAESALATEVAAKAGLPPSAVLAGRTTLAELAAVVAAARLVVSGDTGVAHLATAVGTPSVVLFGPIPPSEWGPPRSRPRHVALWAGRRGDPHGLAVDPGLMEISVQDVLSAADAAAAACSASGR